jgi:hypothetical protein
MELRHEVFVLMAMKIVAFLDVMQCSLVEVYHLLSD